MSTAAKSTSRQTFREGIAALPGVGAELSRRIIDIGICTLEDLEMACYDGRLAKLAGFGSARIARLKRALDAQLGHDHSADPPHMRPPVELLLELDSDYRRLAAADQLPRIAPLRFNPFHRPWLPVMHSDRAGWSFSLGYSNTARAYTMNKRRDWLVIAYRREDEPNAKRHLCTVVTEHRAHLYGMRVVRGREEECYRYYSNLEIPEELVQWAHELSASL